LPVSSTKIETGALLPSWAGTVEKDPEAIDVPLGDPVGRIEGQRGLVMLARLAELAELPERLRETILRLGVGPELEQPAVRLRRL
jgi:hypothetical protein